MPDCTHFIFVDFENVPDVDLEHVRGKPVHVTLLIGAKQTKVPTRLALQFKSFSAQVEPIEVGGSGRNALDLTLAMYLGREIERHPSATFVVISRDKDFDPMLAHLHAAQCDVRRCPAFAEAPCFATQSRSGNRQPRKPRGRRNTGAAATAPTSPTATEAAAKPADTPLPPRIGAGPIPDLAQRQNAIFSRLSNPTNKNRPATQKALAAHLRTALGNDASDADVAAMLALLEERRVLSIDTQKRIVYARR